MATIVQAERVKVTVKDLKGRSIPIGARAVATSACSPR